MLNGCDMLTMLNQNTPDDNWRVIVELRAVEEHYTQDSVKQLIKLLKDLADHLTVQLIEFDKAN